MTKTLTVTKARELAHEALTALRANAEVITPHTEEGKALWEAILTEVDENIAPGAAPRALDDVSEAIIAALEMYQGFDLAYLVVEEPTEWNVMTEAPAYMTFEDRVHVLMVATASGALVQEIRDAWEEALGTDPYNDDEAVIV